MQWSSACKGGTSPGWYVVGLAAGRDRLTDVTARAGLAFLGSLVLLLTGCRRSAFPDVPDGYREFAYVSNTGGNTVSVLDLVFLRADRTLQVGTGPGALAINPAKNEVYAANAGSSSLTVIDTDRNVVSWTIAVGRQPSSIAVEGNGQRAFVANFGSNSISVVDLEKRRVTLTVAAGEQPALLRLAPDGRSLVVTNRSGSVSVFGVAARDETRPTLRLRASFAGCPGAGDAVVLPDSSKAFIVCTGGHQVMALGLAVAPDSWAARHDTSLTTDRFLAMLDVGQAPVRLALKPDGGEVFVSNAASDSVSEIATGTNEVGGTYLIGSRPAVGLVSADNATLWVAASGADAISLYSIDDGRLVSSVRTGAGPEAMAFSADEHLLLTADARSGDVSVVRTQGKLGPALFTILPAGAAPSAIVVKAMAGN